MHLRKTKPRRSSRPAMRTPAKLARPPYRLGGVRLYQAIAIPALRGARAGEQICGSPTCRHVRSDWLTPMPSATPPTRTKQCVQELWRARRPVAPSRALTGLHLWRGHRQVVDPQSAPEQLLGRPTIGAGKHCGRLSCVRWRAAVALRRRCHCYRGAMIFKLARACELRLL